MRNLGFSKVLEAVLWERWPSLVPQRGIHPAISAAHIVPKVLCSLQIGAAAELREEEGGQRHAEEESRSRACV